MAKEEEITTPPTSLQKLIKEAEENDSKENNFSANFVIEIPFFSRTSTGLKLALRVLRVLRVTVKPEVTMWIKGSEMYDDLTDDQGESWHSLDWTEEKQ